MFQEFDVVIVRALLTPARRVDGTEGVVRQPIVGDVGTIVHVHTPSDYIVESVDDRGYTIWLADFSINELALPREGWTFTAEEISPGVYRARGEGPRNMRTESTDTDPVRAIAKCREFALRYPG